MNPTPPARPQSPHVHRVRAFIAVTPPIATINQVGDVQAELRARARQAGLKVGWVALANLHVTLKFLAEIPEESVYAVRDLLGDRLAGRAGFHLRLRGLGAFPSRTAPRVLWIGVESEGEALPHLAGEVDGWLGELGFAREKRAFSPHLTLGRVKGGAADVLEGLESTDLGSCAVSEVVLYQSVLKRQGPEYTPLARIPLRPPPRAAEAPRPDPGAAVDRGAAPAGETETETETETE